MSRFIIALFLLMTAQQVNAAECGSTANRAGCVGPNGAASYNKNTGAVHSTQPSHSTESLRARAFAAGMATVPPRLWNPDARSSMADGFAIEGADTPRFALVVMGESGVFRVTGTAFEFDGYRCAQPILRSPDSTTVYALGWVERSDTHHLSSIPLSLKML